MKSVTRFLLLLMALSLGALPAMARDEVELPPVERQFTSVNGAFALTIIRPEPERFEKDKYPQAALYRIMAGGQHVQLWSKPLDIYVGPRYVVVGNKGNVVFFDEWLRKTDTDYAIQGFSPAGDRMYTHKLQDLVSLVGNPLVKEQGRAAYGSWLSALPRLVDPDHIGLEVRGRPLTLRISDGTIKKGP